MAANSSFLVHDFDCGEIDLTGLGFDFGTGSSGGGRILKTLDVGKIFIGETSGIEVFEGFSFAFFNCGRSCAGKGVASLNESPDVLTFGE